MKKLGDFNVNDPIVIVPSEWLEDVVILGKCMPDFKEEEILATISSSYRNCVYIKSMLFFKDEIVYSTQDIYSKVKVKSISNVSEKYPRTLTESLSANQYWYLFDSVAAFVAYKNFVKNNKLKIICQQGCWKVYELLDLVNNSNDFRFRQLIFEPDWLKDYPPKKEWTKKEKSKLIESLILNIPLPPIVIYDNQEYNDQESRFIYVYDLIDGRQRLKIILEFLKEGLVLEGLQFLTELNGKRYDDLSDNKLSAFKNRQLSWVILFQEQESLLAEEIISLKKEMYERYNKK